MSQERELKFVLPSNEDYERVRGALGDPVRRLEQRNLYLDSPAFALRAARVMLRVRVDASSTVLAIKRRIARDTSGYFQMHEQELALPHPWDGQLERLLGLPLVATLRDSVTFDALTIIGEMQNLRLCFPRQGYLLELDRTTFPDGSVDYEIEAETDEPERVAAEISALCAAAGARIEPQTRTKYERFLQRLKG